VLGTEVSWQWLISFLFTSRQEDSNSVRLRHGPYADFRHLGTCRQQ